MHRPRLAFHTWPAAIYAIGDVHGCYEQLLEIEAAIADDGAAFPGEKWLVTLGDHIDRGPASSAVIEHVMGPAPEGFRRFSLVGNHEQAMLDFLEDPATHAYWLDEGGTETLASYGGGSPPATHLDFIRGMPICLSLPGWFFVHAGIRPGVPLAEQTEEDMLWIRAPFLNSQLTGGLRVVHGHTPSDSIVVTPHRIGIDTQCYATGQLSAVRVTPDGGTGFLAVSGPPSDGRR